jgi:hypothetical protein
MVSTLTWEELTVARFNEAKAKLKEYEDRLKQDQMEVDYWTKYLSAIDAVLTLAQKQNERKPIHSEQLLTKTTWDNLTMIMKANKGILVVGEAVSFLVEAKVFNDREHARNVIYSTLYAHKQDVHKVRPGVYRFIELDTSKPVVKDFGGQLPSGKKKSDLHLKEPIAKIKANNPHLTRDEVLEILIKDGFPFQGRNPKKAIVMAWVSLGYAKNPPIQQLLSIGIPSVQGIKTTL